MKSTWARPSLSRDFTILTVLIVAALIVLSVWVSWSTYTHQSERILENLKKEATRIDKTLEREIAHTNYLLNALAHQISRSNHQDLKTIAQLLKTFDARDQVYAIWAWTNVDKHIVVSSNRGILEEPLDLSDRDYVQKAQADPWRLQIGVPIQGRVSERWVIPIGLGVTDDTGRFIGTLSASVDIDTLTQEIAHLVRREGVSFGIVSKDMVKLTEASDMSQFIDTYFPAKRLSHIDISKEPSGIFSQAKLFPNFHGIYAYYQLSERYPYILLIGYNVQHSQRELERLLLPRLLQIGTLAGFLLLFLWVVRSRIIRPVVELSGITGKLIQGQPYHHETRIGPVEIDQLAMQISRVSDYVDERKRLEEELREKLEAFLLKEKEQKASSPPLVSE